MWNNCVDIDIAGKNFLDRRRCNIVFLEKDEWNMAIGFSPGRGCGRPWLIGAMPLPGR